MTNQKRALAGIIAVAVLIVMLFSIAYIVHEADHDCIGDGCSICNQIGVCISALKTLSYGVIAAALAAAFKPVLFIKLLRFSSPVPKGTLVALKVKLSI